eukprot:2897314-Pleurochrysis_carterae.AAC.1
MPHPTVPPRRPARRGERRARVRRHCGEHRAATTRRRGDDGGRAAATARASRTSGTLRKLAARGSGRWRAARRAIRRRPPGSRQPTGEGSARRGQRLVEARRWPRRAPRRRQEPSPGRAPGRETGSPRRG